MKVLLDIKDNKAKFILKLLSNFKFVKAKPLNEEKEEILANIKEAVAEMKQIKAGKLKARNAEDFLN